jgi:parallel beta-helix repeat protein
VIRLKSTLVTSLIISFLLTTLIFGANTILAQAQPKITVVGTPDEERPVDFTSIQAAINTASSGDTILVYKGTYNESVQINKNVFVVGEDRELTIINNDTADAVFSLRADRVTVKNFTIKKAGTGPAGIGVQILSGHNVISQNKILSLQEGILVYSYANNTISDNVILSNTNTGINLYLSSGNTILRNVMSRNSVGVYFSFSGSNTFSGNIVSNNSIGMIISPYSNNNTFYQNDFVDNGDQISTSGSVNVWNYGGEGNYWSTYSGTDGNADGIGDSFYSIDVANRDNKPLMGMFSRFVATSGRQEVSVTIISNSTVSDFRFQTGQETGNQILLYNINGEDGTTGFSRIAIPIQLMNYSLMLVGAEEAHPKPLNNSNNDYTVLYFTYPHSAQTVAIISSRTFVMYNELAEKYDKLMKELDSLNTSYLDLLSNYAAFLEEYGQLQQDYDALNSSYYSHLSNYSESLENMRSLMYIFAAATGVLIIATIYLSKRAHTESTKTKEEGKETTVTTQ